MSEQDLFFPAPSAADVNDAKAKHRRVHAFTTAGHTVLCKPLSRATWKRIQRIQKDPESAEDIVDVLLLDTLVYPEREKMEALLEDFPAAFEKVAVDLIALASNEAMKRGKAALRRSTRPRVPKGWGSRPSRSSRSSRVRTRRTPRLAPCSSPR